MLLASGELVGLALGVLAHLDGVEGFLGALLAFGAWDFADAEAEGDILFDGHVWPEGVGLEDHAGVACVGGGVGDVFVVEEDGAACGVDEAGDHAEECGFAAAGGTEEEEEFAGRDFEVDAVDGGGGGFAAAEGFVEVSDGDCGGHGQMARGQMSGWHTASRELGSERGAVGTTGRARPGREE